MFTGIIGGLGSVRRLTRHDEDAVLECETSIDLSDVRIGDSISVNGACLTVVVKSGRSFAADVSAETLMRTNLGMLRPADNVNLEKSLRLHDFLGGHIVLGHVDGIGRIRELTPKAGSLLFRVEVDEGLSRYIVAKGSIAIDGISLTVNSCEKASFYVNIIPHTARSTTMGKRKVGDQVNIETDIIGKYVEKLLVRGKTGGGLDMEFLAKHGFLQ